MIANNYMQEVTPDGETDLIMDDLGFDPIDFN